MPWTPTRADPVRFPFAAPARAPDAPRDVLRLRGRFRGRRGLLAFLAVMGPGLIAGIAGNDAGGITTYSVMGADDRAVAAVDLPDHDRHPGDRPGDGGAARRRHRAGPVGPDPRPVRRALDGLRDGRPAGRQRRQHGRRVRRRRGRRSRSSASRATSRCRSSALAHLGAGAIQASYRTVERVFLSVMVVFLTYIASAILADPDWGAGRAGARHARQLDLGAGQLLLVVAVVGTTITPYMQFYLTSARGREGHRRGRAAARAGRRHRRLDLDQRHRDLHRRRGRGDDRHGGRRRSTSAADAAQALEPVAGPPGRGALRGRAVRRQRARRDDHAALDGVRDLRGVRLGDRASASASATRRAFFSIYTFVLARRRAGRAAARPRPAAGDHRVAEPAGPAAAGRARLHGPAGQRRAADGRATATAGSATSSPGRRSGSWSSSTSSCSASSALGFVGIRVG